MTQIQDFEITRFTFKRDRRIGDAQVQSDTHYLAVLELMTDDGHVGTGFCQRLFHPLPDVDELKRIFMLEVFPSIHLDDPFTLVNRLGRPRGGNRIALPYGFGQALNQALWDLQGKILDLPLYRLLGGKDNRVRAYASGLGFHLSDDDLTSFFSQAAAQGFDAFKIKVGHPDLSWDLNRIDRVQQAVGQGATLMVDANESWSPKEAIRRAHAYREAGFDIYWIEDPCLRDDYAGLARVAQAVPFTHINTGEYLDLSGKRRLVEHGSADILNIHGHISDTLHAAWVAAEHGIPVSLGNTPFEVGVHAAAALPEVIWMEYSYHNQDHLLEHPFEFKDGYAYAPERPGHGLALSETARREYARPTIADDVQETTPPPGRIRL